MVRKNEPRPQYGTELVIRSGKHGPFLGCPHYPEYDCIRPLESSTDERVVKVLEGKLCLTCGAELVLRQGRFDIFIRCSGCPVYDHTELIDKPDETAIVCPQCQTGYLAQRRSRYGETSYFCNRYPECQFVVNFKPLTGECPECRYPLLIEKKAAQGVEHFCASKQCGKPISAG